MLPPIRISDRRCVADRSDTAQPFEIKAIPQITNIQFWRRFGGTETSERGADSAEVHFRVIRDSHRRVMVVMTHNTDVADSWEREGEDPQFFYQFSPAGYALGIDVLLTR